MAGAIRKVCVDGDRLTCELHVDPGKANAVRRALLNDVSSCAPADVVFDVNTTCMPDEYIAHRIGLVPFDRACAVDYVEAALDVCGRDVLSGDFVGATSAQSDVPIIKMLPGQRLKCRARVRRDTGAAHARYCPVAAAGVGRAADGCPSTLSFEVLTNDDPVDVLRNAVNSLRARLLSLRERVEPSPRERVES
jgi:hypothetical protein